MKKLISALCIVFALISCKENDENPTDPQSNGSQLKISLEFDETLPRLGNFGEVDDVPAGNAAQSPNMNEVSIHYVEFAPDSLTPLGWGEIVYQGVETTAGGDQAVNFNQSAKGADGEVILEVDRTSLPAGTYNWLRVSLTYQNYDIDFRLNVDPWIVDEDFTGTIASFVGFNTFINSHTVKDSTLVVNANRLQGYWAFESGLEFAGQSYGNVSSGEGAGVTVVNPLSATSPIQPGSCVVTGKLAEPLVVTGDESEDLHVVLAFSINNSFEWEDLDPDGKFEPGAGESVVDMGLRGLHPYVLE